MYLRNFTYLFFCGGASLIGVSANRVAGGPLYDLFFIGTFVVWIFSGNEGLKKKFIEQYWWIGFLLAFVGFLISGIYSDDISDSLLQLTKFIFSFFVFFAILPSVLNSKDRYILFCRFVAFSGAFNGIGALFQALYGLGDWGGEATWGRMTGFSEHPNELGLHTAICCVVLLYLFFADFRFNHRVLYFLGFVFSLIGLVLSASITAVMALIISILFVSFFEIRRNNKEFFALFFVVIIVAFFVVTGFAILGDDNNIIDRVINQKELAADEGTLGSRMDTYLVAIERIGNNPILGVGNSVENAVTETGFLVHNIFLRAFREGGIFSFIGLVFIFISIFVKIFRSLFSNYVASTESIYSFALFSVLFISVSFGPAFFQRIVWMTLGMVISSFFVSNNADRPVR